MTIKFQLIRIGRLAIAPLKGFFRWETRIADTPRFDPKHTTLWAHVKEIARQDVALLFEPVTKAVKEVKQELAKPY